MHRAKWLSPGLAGRALAAPHWRQAPLRRTKGRQHLRAKPAYCGLLAALLKPHKGRESALGLVNTAGSFLSTLEDNQGGNLSKCKWLGMKKPSRITCPIPPRQQAVWGLCSKCPSLPPLPLLTSLSLSVSLRVFASFFFSHLCKGNRHDAESPLWFPEAQVWWEVRHTDVFVFLFSFDRTCMINWFVDLCFQRLQKFSN